MSSGATSAPNSTLTTTAEVATRAGFLCLFILISFIGNIVLVATVVQSRSLRKVRMNFIILSLSFANILNCVCNMPLVLGYTITNNWDYGEELCRVNSCLMQLFSIAMIMGIAMMSLDRLIAVRNPSKYDTIMSRCLCNSLIVCTWLQAGAFSFPLLSTAILSVPFKTRYLCSIKPGTTVTYPVITSVICYLTPFVMILTSFIVIIKEALQEKATKAQFSRDHRYTDSLITETPKWKEIKRTRFVVCLFIFWLLLEGPYLLYTYIEQCHSSPEIQGTSDTSNSLFARNSAIMNILEISFTWMKFSNCMVLPFAAFFYRKNIWQKFKDLILCRKSNLIVDAGGSENGNNNNKSENALKNTFLEKKMFKVPVLFATSRGIHVKKLNDENESQELSESQDSEYFFADMTSKSNDIKIVRNKVKKCDVNGPDSPHNMDGDTSDYDSSAELDLFSVSDPSMLKSKKNQDSSVHIRSKSETIGSKDSAIITTARTPRSVVAELDESNVSQKKERKRNSSQNDSGMDSNFNSTEKRRKKRRSQEASAEEVSEPAEQKTVEGRADSNDSGRGSVKEVEKRKKKRRKVSTVDTTGEEAEIPSNQSSPRDHPDTNQNSPREKKSSNQRMSKEKQPFCPVTITSDGEVNSPVAEIPDNSKIKISGDNVVAKPKTKKKRRPKSQSDEPLSQTVMEVNNPVFECDVDRDLTSTRRPPARLEPLDHKNIRTSKTSPIPPLRSMSEVQPEDNQPSGTVTKRVRNRTNSGSKDTEQTSTAQKITPRSDEVSKRRRRSTADSQTPLMNSGSSAELRDIKMTSESKGRRKRKSEVTPNSDLDSTQSPR